MNVLAYLLPRRPSLGFDGRDKRGISVGHVCVMYRQKRWNPVSYKYEVLRSRALCLEDESVLHQLHGFTVAQIIYIDCFHHTYICMYVPTSRPPLLLPNIEQNSGWVPGTLFPSVCGDRDHEINTNIYNRSVRSALENGSDLWDDDETPFGLVDSAEKIWEWLQGPVVDLAYTDTNNRCA